jgi:hypothetical protein
MEGVTGQLFPRLQVSWAAYAPLGVGCPWGRVGRSGMEPVVQRQALAAIQPPSAGLSGI